MTTRARSLALAFAAAAAAATPLPAQYFGRNKVQYEDFKFRILATQHFDVYYYEPAADAARLTARMAERWYERLSKVLGHELRGRQPLVLYADHPDFEQTNVISGEISEATGGVTESLKRRIVLPLAGSLHETDHVLGHELVHAFQYDITGQGGGGTRLFPGAARLPLWFIEGMAEYLSLGPADAHTAMWMRDAVGRDVLPAITKLEDPRLFPYRWGQALWAYLAGQYGQEVVGATLRAASKARDPFVALSQVTARPVDSLSADWHAALRAAYAPAAAVTDSAAAVARRVLGGGERGRLNVAPALSPDGSRLVFLSERSLFAIEMYLADVETGAIERKLVETALDAHYESLQFLASAGAWDQAGRRFAFAGVARGQPVLTVLDVQSSQVEREVPFPELGEIFNPTWSPDGQAVAFSAAAGGFTDLYVYDFAASALRRLTDDPYADLQPAWSPDGRAIAFVTDRFTTRLGTIDAGAYRLALVDPQTGAARALPGLDGAKHINPQWSPDGRSLYFVSDPHGISNVFRLEVASGEIAQVTNLYVGVSGITALSPALSVAARSGRLMFSEYSAGGAALYAMDDPPARRLAAAPPGAPGVLPPGPGRAAAFVAALADARTGLPADSGWTEKGYRAGLSLDFIAQPSLAIAVDRFGTYVGGGATLYWSDMLSNHSVVTMAQVSGSFRNFAAAIAYENRRSRLNWGAVAQQIPFLTGRFARGFQGPYYVEQVEIFRQTHRSLAGLAAYPFSRVQRVEIQAGVQHIGFSHEIEKHGYLGGQPAYDSTYDLPAPPGLTLGMASAALVYDNSYFGATSPLLGQRWRLELAPTVGSLAFTSVIADYRRYVMPVRPFALAGRVMHVARYGRSADDSRIYPYYLGYPSIVRGYDLNSFEASECPQGTGTCPVFDNLLGSRMLVGNAELRFPLFGVLGLGQGFYGFLPVEMALFADAGVAWTGSDSPELFGGSRPGVASVGATLRMNLFGYAVAQLDYAKPFQRPEKGWHLTFSLTPGF